MASAQTSKAPGVDVDKLEHRWGKSLIDAGCSKKTPADRAGVKPRTIQRHIARMESAGFVRRVEWRHRNGGNKTNRYSFNGLIREAEPFAQEVLKEREKRKHEKSAPDARKGRHLHAV